MAHDDALFDRTFTDSPIGMLVTDERGAVTAANHAFSCLTGHDAGALVGRMALSLMHPDDVEGERALARQLTSGERDSYQAHRRLLHRSGDVVWTRSTVSRVAGPRGEAQYVAQVEDITDVRRARDVLARRSMVHDPLTGLASGPLLLDRLGVSLQVHRTRSTTVACVFLDVDHFTLVNDSFGHEAGDALLIEIARRVQHAVRPGDTVGRLGGDEFVIVLEDVADQAAAEQLLEGIAAAVHEPLVVAGREVVPTVSAGLALAEPGITAESLVRNADSAMSHAKHSGRNRIEVFTEELRASALVRLSIEAELRTALREGELVVHYQPIVDLATRETVALEALVRWDHPSRGLLLPDHFIEICEAANLIVPLGSFVLHEACRFIADRPGFTGRVLVNVSTQQIGTADLAAVVRAALAETGVDPSRLSLELTESGMLLATQAAHADLAALSDMGVELIIDDFGTGYSALSSVLLNPVAGLKLAREFTLRLGDEATGDRISSAVASLVESLGICGIIEGVETEAQRRQALRQGWTWGRGFLFSHPLPAADIDRLVLHADAPAHVR